MIPGGQQPVSALSAQTIGASAAHDLFALTDEQILDIAPENQVQQVASEKSIPVESPADTVNRAQAGAPVIPEPCLLYTSPSPRD